MLPVVMLHGFLGQPSMWSEVAREVEQERRVSLLRLPGHGAEPWLSEGATTTSAADALVGTLASERVILVGYSMGGRLALTMACRHPDRIAGVVAIGAHPGLRSVDERAARVRRDDADAEKLCSGPRGLEGFVDEWETLPLFASQRALPAATRAEQRAARLAHRPEALAWAMRALGLGRMPPLWTALAPIADRVHLVVGALDERYLALTAELVAAVPAIGRTVVPGAGHNVALEAPRELADLIKRRAACLDVGYAPRS